MFGKENKEPEKTSGLFVDTGEEIEVELTKEEGGVIEEEFGTKVIEEEFGTGIMGEESGLGVIEEEIVGSKEEERPWSLFLQLQVAFKGNPGQIRHLAGCLFFLPIFSPLSNNL